MKRIVLQVLVPVALVGGAAGGAYLLVTNPDKAERKPAEQTAPLVEVAEAEQATPHAIVTGTGVVEPAKEVTISPEVTGRVVFVAPQLVSGGRLQKGEILLRIDPQDYRLALRERQSQVKQAELELELEQGRAAVAEREWELLAKDDGRPKNALALREPQLETAQVALESAQAAVARARRDLEKTVIRAPFNASVTSEQVEVGDIARPGSPLATLIGTDEFWAEIALPVEQLALIEVPGYAASQGSPAEVVQELGPRQNIERRAHVIRLANEIDRESRTAKVILGIPTPLDSPNATLPLLPGAFVTARITGRQLDQAVAVPRVAVVGGDEVWIVDDSGKLRRRRLETVFATDDKVYAVAGIDAGARVVTSPMTEAIEGMKVRTEPYRSETAPDAETDPDATEPGVAGPSAPADATTARHSDASDLVAQDKSAPARKLEG